MSKQYICITSDGVATIKKRMSLKQMQEFVGGYIEYYGKIVCNESGRVFNLLPNKVCPFIRGNLIIEVDIK